MPPGLQKFEQETHQDAASFPGAHYSFGLSRFWATKTGPVVLSPPGHACLSMHTARQDPATRKLLVPLAGKLIARLATQHFAPKYSKAGYSFA
jgi:hypothetical protein